MQALIPLVLPYSYNTDIPSPPQWASIMEVPTEVPGSSPSSCATPSLRPRPTGIPGMRISVPILRLRGRKFQKDSFQP